MSDSLPIVSNHKPNGKFAPGNNANALPYDERLIRDSLKGCIYKAVAGLTMTMEDAEKYYTRPGVSVLEQMFFEAMTRKNWGVFDAFLDRTVGPVIKMQLLNVVHETKRPDLSKLTFKELLQLERLYEKAGYKL